GRCLQNVTWEIGPPVKELNTFFFSSSRRHTISKRDWSSDVCSSDLVLGSDESKALVGVEPLHSSGGHGFLLPNESRPTVDLGSHGVRRLHLVKKNAPEPRSGSWGVRRSFTATYAQRTGQFTEVTVQPLTDALPRERTCPGGRSRGNQHPRAGAAAWRGRPGTFMSWHDGGSHRTKAGAPWRRGRVGRRNLRRCGPPCGTRWRSWPSRCRAPRWRCGYRRRVWSR